MKKIIVLFVALILLFGIVGVYSEETGGDTGGSTGDAGTGDTESSGPAPLPDPDYTEVKEEGIDITKHFEGFDNTDTRVYAKGLTKDQKVDVRTDYKDRSIRIEGNHDFKIEFKKELPDGYSYVEREYSGFQENNDIGNKLHFDKDGELKDGTSFKSKGGENGEGRDFDYKSHRAKLYEGDKVDINKDEKSGKDVVEIQTDKKIKQIQELPIPVSPDPPGSPKADWLKDEPERPPGLTPIAPNPDAKPILDESGEVEPEGPEPDMAYPNPDAEPIPDPDAPEIPEFKFKTQGDDVVLEDKRGVEISISGTIRSEGDQLYHKGDENLNLGKIEIGNGKIEENQNERTDIFLDSKHYKTLSYMDPKAYIYPYSPPSKGSFMVIDKKNEFFALGTTNEKNSPILKFSSENEIIKYQEDVYKRTLAIQAKGSDKISLAIIKKNAEEGKWHEAEFYGPISADFDDNNLHGEKNDLMIDIRGAKLVDDAKGTATVPMRIRFYDSEGNPLNNKNMDLYVNALNQWVSIPKNIPENFFDEKGGFYKTEAGFAVSPYLKRNYLTLEEQRLISGLDDGQRAQFVEDGFFDDKGMPPAKKREYIKEHKRSIEPPKKPNIPIPTPDDKPAEQPKPEDNSGERLINTGAGQIAPIIQHLKNKYPNQYNILKNSNKKLYLFKFSTDNCKWCNVLDNTIADMKRDGQWPTDVEVIKVHIKKEDAKLAEQYGIKSFPNSLLINDQGNVIGGIKGAKSNTYLQSILNKYL